MTFLFDCHGAVCEWSPSFKFPASRLAFFLARALAMFSKGGNRSQALQEARSARENRQAAKRKEIAIVKIQARRLKKEIELVQNGSSVSRLQARVRGFLQRRRIIQSAR